MENVIILTEQDSEYVAKDYVANKIKESFDIKNFGLQVYANVEWSFYSYIATTKLGVPVTLLMRGHCLVNNQSRECIEYVRQEENDLYSARVADDKKIKFKLEKPPIKNEYNFPKF